MLHPKRKIEYLKIADLEFAKFNPPIRLKEGTRINRALLGSIKVYGVLSPIIVVPVNSGYLIADGHRRVKMAGLVGFDDIPAVVLGSDNDPLHEIIYLQQFTARNPQGPEVGHVWSFEPSAIPVYHRRNYAILAAAFGEKEAKALCRKGPGMSPSGINAAKMIARMCMFGTSGDAPRVNWKSDEEGLKWIKIVLEWAHEHRGFGDLRTFDRLAKQGALEISLLKRVFENGWSMNRFWRERDAYRKPKSKTED